MLGTGLLIVDHEASVGGIAGAFADLASLGATHVELERMSTPVLSLGLDRVAKLTEEQAASVVALGVSDATRLQDVGLKGRAALKNHPTIYLSVGPPVGGLLPARTHVLDHILVPADYSVRSGCVGACLLDVARRGARSVSLMHVADEHLSRTCVYRPSGELGRVDVEWIEYLKRCLLRAGVEQVRFTSSAPRSHTIAELGPDVSLVIVGSTCNDEIARAYVAEASRAHEQARVAPALMLTAESCAANARSLGAA